MAKINRNELTKETIEKAMACKTVDELLALAKSQDYEMTREEAEAYMAELEDYELDEEAMKAVAGGRACYAVDGCPMKINLGKCIRHDKNQ